MPHVSAHGHTVRFGSFEADLSSGELRRNGSRVKLQELPFRFLATLLEQPGSVVTREELQERLWPGGTHVDFERGLGTALNKVRTALADTAAAPRFIETVPRRGYRFIAAVEGVEITGVGSATTPVPARWRTLTAYCVAIAIVAAGFIAWMRWRPRPLTGHDVLVLADFTNSTGETVFDGTLRDALAFKLEESPFLKVLDDEVVRQDLELMRHAPNDRITNELAHDICVREGDKAVINGSIAALGKSYAIELKAANCQTGATVARQQAEAADKEHVLKALAKAAQGMRAKLGESLASIQELAPPDFPVTTGSIEAYQAFTTGWRLFYQSRFVESIPFLKRATDLDPDLALAYWVLASASLNTGGGADPRVAQGYSAKAKALRDRVSTVERFRIGPPGDNSDEHLKNVELWAATYPRDSAPFAQAALIHFQRGEFEEALPWQQQAYRLSPRSSFNGVSLMKLYVALDRFADAKAVGQQVLERGLDNWQAHQRLLQIAWIEDDPDGAARQVEWFAGKPDEYRNLEDQAAHARMLGELQHSRDLLKHGADLARRRGLEDVAARLLAPNAAGDALVGDCDSTRKVRQELLLFFDRQIILALCGDAPMARKAERRVMEISQLRGSDSQWNNAELPLIRGAIEFSRGHPDIAIEQLSSIAPYERAFTFAVYLRGLAFLRRRKGVDAEAEFQKIIDHKGAHWGPMYPLSYLGLARAAALVGETARSRHAYENFLAMWKDADPGLPVLIQARTEYSRLAR